MHPFFLECALREPNSVVAAKFRRLAFGDNSVGLVFNRDTERILALGDTLQFVVPATYDAVQHERVKQSLLTLGRAWKEVDLELRQQPPKKMEKVRALDRFVLRRICSDEHGAVASAAIVKRVIILALILKVLTMSDDIEMDGRHVKSVCGLTMAKDLVETFDAGFLARSTFRGESSMFADESMF